MSSGKNGAEQNHGRRRKKKTKRPASSPLNESERYRKTGFARSECSDDQCDVNTSSYEGNVSTQADQFAWDENYYIPNMAYSQQFGNVSFGNQGVPVMQGGYPSHPQSTPIQGFTPPSPTMINGQPPEWAKAMQNDLKDIKAKVMKIEKIENAVNQINSKIGELEANVNGMNKRLETVETSCTFISDKYDTQKKELDKTQTEIQNLRQACSSLQENAKGLENDKINLESKIVDLEYRSMRDNLMFYGIAEKENENCEEEIKTVIRDVLQYTDAAKLSFDRVHRVGKPNRNNTRPIVAKFHYYKEREIVRNKSFELADEMKKLNLGIGTQMPKQMRENRKSLREVMKRESDKGNTVKMIRGKLYVNGRQYEADAEATAGSSRR